MTRMFVTTLLGLAAAPALADGTTNMCLNLGKPAPVCACATEALNSELAAEDIALYDKVGILYLANMAAGQPMAEAWDAALGRVATEMDSSVSTLRPRTNGAGKAHRAAINSCG